MNSHSEQKTGNEKLNAALNYTSIEWPVLPLYEPLSSGCSCGKPSCNHPGKHPRTRHGYKDATADAAQINRWWGAHPDANVGVGTNRLLILDIDKRHDGFDSLRKLEELYGLLPDTVTAITGGNGRHYYFHVNGHQLKSAQNIGGFSGIDVITGGAHIVAPPSLHPSGRNYQWKPGCSPDDLEPADIPKWLVEIMESHQRQKRNGSSIQANREESDNSASQGPSVSKEFHPPGNAKLEFWKDIWEDWGINPKPGKHTYLCPFHEDTQDSLVIWGDTCGWYCFGCGEGGGVSELMEASDRAYCTKSQADVRESITAKHKSNGHADIGWSELLLELPPLPEPPPLQPWEDLESSWNSVDLSSSQECSFKLFMAKKHTNKHRRLTVSCKNWKCKRCGPDLKIQWGVHLVSCLRDRSPGSEFFVHEVQPGTEFDSLQKRIKRGGGNYFKIEREDGTLLVISTVECNGRLISRNEACRLTYEAVSALPFDRRRISTSAGWRLAKAERVNEWKALPFKSLLTDDEFCDDLNTLGITHRKKVYPPAERAKTLVGGLVPRVDSKHSDVFFDFPKWFFEDDCWMRNQALELLCKQDSWPYPLPKDERHQNIKEFIPLGLTLMDGKRVEKLTKVANLMVPADHLGRDALYEYKYGNAVSHMRTEVDKDMRGWQDGHYNSQPDPWEGIRDQIELEELMPIQGQFNRLQVE